MTKIMYQIDQSCLKKGDIVLTRSNNPQSLRIMRLSGSTYSHAILYVGEMSCIESDGLGVQSQNLQRLLVEDTNNVIVLRLSKDFDKKLTKVIERARQLIGTEYSGSEARLSLQGVKKEAAQPNRQFCTRFIAQAYEYAGIKLVSNSSYCTPEELYNSKNLIKIKPQFIEVTGKELEYFTNENNPISQQTEIHNTIFENTRNLTGEDIQTFEQLFQFILDNRKFERQIIEIIRKTGYFDMWRIDIKENPWWYDESIFLEKIKSDEDRRTYAVFFSETEVDTRLRFQFTLDAARHCYKFFNQEFFQLFINLCENLIKQSMIREEVGRKILKKLAD